MKFHLHHPRSNASAFTMVEIALCLAIVGFALVAIIGVLPAGLNVQRENREDTILNQDSTVWMDAIRAGARTNRFGVLDQFGVSDELTNFVDRIVVTNWSYRFDATSTNLERTFVYVGQKLPVSIPGVTTVLITNGARIVGLLSTPRIVPIDDTHFSSNYVIAYCRAMSGTASEKPQQANADVRDAAFTYRMVVDITPVGSVDPEGVQTNEVDRILRDNLAEVRLLFRWPLKAALDPNNINLELPAAGNSKLVARTQIGGKIYADSTLDLPRTKTPFYFVQPRDYSK